MRLIASVLLLSMSTAGALAQAEKQAEGEGSVKIGKQAGVKLAQDECKAAWTKANPANKPKISAGQASPFIADLKAANTTGDGAIDQEEFMAACDKGLMKDQASAGSGGNAATGAGAGTEGAGPPPAQPSPSSP